MRWDGRDLSFGRRGQKTPTYWLEGSREAHLRGYTLAILSPYQVGHHPVAPAAAPNPLPPPPSSHITDTEILIHEHIHTTYTIIYTALTYIIYHTSYTVQGKAVTAQDMLSRSMSVTVDSKDAKLIGGGYRGALTRVGLHQAIGLGAELRERYGEFT